MKVNKKSNLAMKLTIDIYNDNKVRSLLHKKRSSPQEMDGRELMGIFFCLICLSIPYGGILMYSENQPYTNELLSEELGFDVEEIENALKCFLHRELLNRIGIDCFSIPIVCEKLTDNK